jgi:(E)-4-hydroxy-3-methylbut-2-enyl-diphosphate synthase
MLKTKTSDIKRAVRTIKELEKEGCEIIRVAVKDGGDANAVKDIKKKIKIPLVCDIHFNYRLALKSIDNGADKIRINPGNISDPEELRAIIKAAKKRKIPMRIGINSGSIIPVIARSEATKQSQKHRLLRPSGARNDRLVESALKYIKFFEGEGFRDIIVSLKSSDVAETVNSYRKLAALCDYPFHLGVTAAGPYDFAIVKSSIGIGSLLLDGIGDTIRVSLTGSPEDEVIAAKRILQALSLRNFGPNIISCPTCGRCQVNLARIVDELQKKLLSTNYYLLTTKRPLAIAIMGCEVNGPGEAREADIGIAFGKDSGLLFRKGKIVKKVEAKNAVKQLLSVITNY